MPQFNGLSGAAAEAGIAPGRAFERQVVMLLRIREAEAVGDDVEKRNVGQWHVLLPAIVVGDAQDRFVGARLEARAERRVLEQTFRSGSARRYQPAVAAA